MKRIIFLLIFFCVLYGCKKNKNNTEIVAQVNKEVLTLAEFKAQFSPEQWKSLTNQQKKEYIQQWINLNLLAQAAEKQGIDKNPDVKFRLKYAAMKVKANALISGRMSSENVSEDDLFNYYRIHQGEFEKPVINYKIQRIYFTDSASLQKVAEEIKNGMKFEDAAKVYSQELLGKTGGFMGLVTPDSPDSIFWHAVKNLKQYEVTTVQKDNGWYLVRYYATETGNSNTGFEAIKDEIRKRIIEERKRQIYDELLKELKSKAEIYIMM